MTDKKTKRLTISSKKKAYLREMAERYETADFLKGDPSWFMHQVTGRENQETMALLASVLSYGSRKAFLPKINALLEMSKGQPYEWVREGGFLLSIPESDTCFYRLYSQRMIREFLRALQTLYLQYGTVGGYLRATGCHTALDAVAAITTWFRPYPIGGIIPKDTSSCCKRVCMLLRWLVRTDSPVDIGIWQDIIRRESLIIPMDTHVVQEALRLGLITTRSTTMTNALRLSAVLRRIFPDDPLKGDFALFGAGINGM